MDIKIKTGCLKSALSSITIGSGSFLFLKNSRILTVKIEQISLNNTLMKSVILEIFKVLSGIKQRKFEKSECLSEDE